MSTAAFVLFALGAAAGGFINGLAGFGTALFALGFWLQIMPPGQAVAIVVVMSVLSGIQGVWVVRRDIDVWRLGRFLVPALLCVPLGILALDHLDVVVLKLLIAGFLILYGGLFAFRSDLPKISDRTPLIDVVVGAIGGLLGGAVGLSGVAPTMWCALKSWTKSQQRAVLQPFNVVILASAAALFAYQGSYDRQTLTYIAIAFPITMVFAQLGIFVFGKLRDTQFRRLLIALMLCAGVIIVVREVLL
jgi:hypothetical protein